MGATRAIEPAARGPNRARRNVPLFGALVPRGRRAAAARHGFLRDVRQRYPRGYPSVTPWPLPPRAAVRGLRHQPSRLLNYCQKKK